jgi:hypothetical protein
MRKLNKTLLFVILIIMLATGCQKELSNERSTTIILNPPTTLDSNYLDTVYEFETQVGGTDTTAYYLYKYDAQKRVVNISWQRGEFLLPYDDSGSIKYLYSGADSLPYQSYMTATYDGMHDFDTTTTFYYYDNAARLTKDSAVNRERNISSPFYRVRRYVNSYSYAAGKIMRQSSDLPIIEPVPTTYPPSYTLDTALLSSNQNPVSAVLYISLNNNTSFVKDYEIVAGYDNNPSPYYKLNISKSFSPMPAIGEPTFFLDFNGRNNYTNYTTNNIAHPGTSSVNYTNFYLNNGYIKKTSFPSNVDPSFTDGYIYTYKPL